MIEWEVALKSEMKAHCLDCGYLMLMSEGLGKVLGLLNLSNRKLLPKGVFFTLPSPVPFLPKMHIFLLVACA